MNAVKIAQLKTHLSSYLQKVRHGSEITITDRQTPIAKLLPFPSLQKKLQITTATRSPHDLKKIKIPKATRGKNSLTVLLEDRDE